MFTEKVMPQIYYPLCIKQYRMYACIVHGYYYYVHKADITLCYVSSIPWPAPPYVLVIAWARVPHVGYWHCSGFESEGSKPL